MAKFKGTIQEFHHFVGPRIRNLINNFTRPHRRDRGGHCEFCGAQAVLHSAHVHGRERRKIIEGVLTSYLDSAGHVVCEIEQIENEILSAHEPIHETFKFICQPCHTQYDATPRLEVVRVASGRNQVTNEEFSKLGRIRLWAHRPRQANHRIIRAFLELETESDVTLDKLRSYCISEYGINTFDAHFASMKTDAGNSHGKVFFESSGLVQLWDIVRIEIEEHFPQN